MDTIKSIKPAFWLANVMEACERLAYFGIRAVLPLMMVSTGVGGLGLSMSDKGAILGVWALIQCIIPMVSGGFSESFGYKKSLIVAFIINTIGYILMANITTLSALFLGPGMHESMNFWLMMIAGCTIGVGTAIFKPPVGGVVAQSLNEKNSGFGFGLFYWVVNVGGFLAPMAASVLRGNEAAPTWSYVFYGAAFVTILNLLITILFFKDPVLKGEQKKENAAQVFVKTLKVLWDDKNILFFLIIVSGFWLMFMQLWDLLPNFIDEWVDRRSIGNFLGQYSIFSSFLEKDGSLKPEMIINIDSAAIILLVIPLSALFARFRMMTALVLGMIISIIGFISSGMTMSGGLVCLAVFGFAIGEIICSPKFDEYIGMSAPDDKKAIYMGFVNIPFAVGWAIGNFLSGPLYEAFSSKIKLGQAWLASHNITTAPVDQLDLANAQKYLTDELHIAKDKLPELINADGLDLNKLKELLAQHNLSLSNDCQQLLTDGKISDLNECQISEAQKLLSDKDLANLIDVIKQNNVTDIPLDYCNLDCTMNQIQAASSTADAYEATAILWNEYNPWSIWIMLGALGVVSLIGMMVFYRTSGMAEKDKAALQKAKEERERAKRAKQNGTVNSEAESPESDEEDDE